jgi:hypothetical protein
MIDAVKQLTADEQRQLLRLLNNTVETARLQDDAVLDSLVDELRNALAVPAKDDLPEYLRRRLVQVARDHFSLGDRFDTYDDVELAVLIVDFVVDAAAALASQDMGGARDEFETFLRTKKREERVAWLIESERLSTLARDGVFDEAAARRRAALISSQDGATAETASTILSDVAAVTGRRKTGRKGRPRLHRAGIEDSGAAGTQLQAGPSDRCALRVRGRPSASLRLAVRRRPDLPMFRVDGRES